MELKSTKAKPLNIVSMKRAVDLTLKEIELNRSEASNKLVTRFSMLNERLMGGFRFKNNVIIGGASGHGKSFFIQMLRTDFLNKELNGNLVTPIKILHFNLEMETSDEIMRELTKTTGISYPDMISAWEKLDDQKLERIKAKLNLMKDEDRLFFVDSPGNIEAVKETIYAFQDKFPSHRLIVTIDHSLLLERLDEPDEIQLMANLGKAIIEIRKKLENLNILISQLNDKIEDPKRRSPGMQFPTKTDFHGSKQIYQAADIVMVLHRPELLGILEYGHSRIPTERLVALHILKYRNFESNVMIRFTEDFKNGNLLPRNENNFIL